MKRAVAAIIIACALAAPAARAADMPVPQGYGEALGWYDRAAKAGSAKAQFLLALMYERGEGRPRNPAKARHWYGMSAKQGFALAQFKLGAFLANGVGGQRDVVSGWAWLDRAARAGIAEAAMARDAIARTMTEDELARARAEAARPPGD